MPLVTRNPVNMQLMSSGSQLQMSYWNPDEWGKPFETICWMPFVVSVWVLGFDLPNPVTSVLKFSFLEVSQLIHTQDSIHASNDGHCPWNLPIYDAFSQTGKLLNTLHVLEPQHVHQHTSRAIVDGSQVTTWNQRPSSGLLESSQHTFFGLAKARRKPGKFQWQTMPMKVRRFKKLIWNLVDSIIICMDAKKNSIYLIKLHNSNNSMCDGAFCFILYVYLRFCMIM